MNAYSINYVFITDIFYLDEYYIDYMSSGNNSNFDPVKDAINTNNHNNDPNNHNKDPNVMQPSVSNTNTHTDMLADYLK